MFPMPRDKHGSSKVYEGRPCVQSEPLFLGLGRAELLQRGSTVSLYYQHPLNHPGEGGAVIGIDAVTVQDLGCRQSQDTKRSGDSSSYL